MRLTDPFPIPHQGLQPTHRLEWDAMAAKVVHDVLRVERNERVILSADPYCGGAMLEAVRMELQRARAIELATILHWTPRLTTLRTESGAKPDPDDARAEDAAIRELFGLADIFIWLQNDWRAARSTVTIGQSEQALADWHGRGLHFHWFHDPNTPDPDHPANKAIDLIYQDAILNLDYARLSRDMHALADAMRERELRVTAPAGTDLRFRTTARFHVNDGDASKAKAARAACARDREEEIPCGALRTVPVRDSVEGVIAFTGGFGYPSMGTGLDVDKWFDQGLRFIFERGRVVRVETDGDQAQLDREWARETGDKDRLGEMVLGCNPLLKPVAGSTFRPYHGFGAGGLRLTIGENLESGGVNRSSLHRWLMLFDASIEAGGVRVLDGGRLRAPA
ncbi:MAG: aminopeptidase [Rhodospirillaceae bacterium]|nr:aminopeptidase [Rhodospirillaceae bacterium]